MNKRKRILLMISIPLVIIIGILSYYQVFYKSKRVDSGIAKTTFVFRKHTAQLRGVRFLPGDELVASASVDSTVRIWKKSNGEVIRILKHPSGVSSIDVSDDGQKIVTGSYDAIIRLWSIPDGVLLKEFKGHSGTVWSVDISKNGDKIASGGNDAIVRIWDIPSAKMVSALAGHSRIVWSVKISPDGEKLASASYDATVKIWNVSGGTLFKTITDHTETVVDLAISNNGKILATTSDDKTIKLFEFPGGVVIRTMNVPEHVQAVAFSSDDSRLITGGRDKPMIGEFLQEIFGNSEFNRGVSMRLWEVQTGKLLQTFTEFSNDVNDVAYSHDGKWIGGASDDNTVRIYLHE